LWQRANERDRLAQRLKLCLKRSVFLQARLQVVALSVAEFAVQVS
jgi:hypothetical protein